MVALRRGKTKSERRSASDLLSEQKILDADIEIAVFVVPAFTDIAANDDIREGVARKGKRLRFAGNFFIGLHRVGGLDTDFLPPRVAMKSISRAVRLPFSPE